MKFDLLSDWLLQHVKIKTILKYGITINNLFKD